AIALLKEQDLAKHPELLPVIASLQATTGNTQGVIDILRERLANTPDGEKMNMQLISQLLNLLPDAETKQAELVKLVDQGLAQEFADILSRVLTSGQPKLEDELKMIDLMQEDLADAALQKYLTYRRWNKEEEGRPLLDKAMQLSPKKPNILEWRYKIALDEKRWDDAEQAIKEMLSLATNERPANAIADGRFMRAQLIAAQAGSMELGEARSKRVRDAIVAYNSALGQYSHYIDGWVQLGRLHLSQENYFAAQDSLQEALNRQSKNVTALELLALAQARGGDPANALENYQRVLAVQPNNASVLNQFTALAMQMGLATRAIELREQIGQRAPKNFDNRRALALLYAQNDAFDNAKKTIQAVIDEQGSTRQNVAVKSQVLANNEEHDQSIKTAKDYIASLGDDAAWQDYLLLAQVYEQAKQVGQADQAFNQAIKLEKQGDTLASLAAFGQAKITRGQVAEAAQMFEGLIAQYPDNDALKQQTAELYLQLRNYDKVETIANSLPESAGRYRLLVQSAASQQGKLGIAIERATKAVKAYPSDFGLRLNLVELLRGQQDLKALDQRDYKTVLAQAKALAKDHADRVEAKVALADVLLRMDRLPDATAQLEQAVSFAPRHIGANDRLFRIRLAQAGSLGASDPQASQDKARQALAIMSILIESRPNNASLLRSAGQAAELAGLKAQAIAYYRQSFEANASAEGLATYAVALLSVNQGANARAILENADNATLVSNNLYLRALRGRAIASVGQTSSATTLFSNLLKESKEPNERMIVARQIATAFRSEPTRAIELFESTMGTDLPVEVDELIAGMLLSRQDYELAAKRLNKYWDKPTADVKTQITLITQLALAQQESAQYTQAKTTYEYVYELIAKNKELASKSQRIQLLNNMAFLLADQKKGYEDEAVKYAEQAVALMSETDSVRQFALIQDTLGWAYHKAGRSEDAVRVLKESVDRLPLVANQLHLGQVYLSLGDKDRALLVLEAAVNQAKSDKDEKMIAETQKWYRQAL
ncbi:MAG: tetratricopeptide repeat protein, partial [Phycisphaeraceae bacterium]